jgi:hypothetical protein
MSGTGKTIIATTGAATLSGSTKILSRTLENHAPNVNWTAGTINAGSGMMENSSDGTLTANSTSLLSFSGPFTNAGTLTKTGVGSVSFTTLGNTGTLQVETGTATVSGSLTNFSGTTLTGGTYNVAGVLQFAGANIVTNAATIILDGVASAIQDTGGANALANYATNDAGGSFTIKNGRNLSRTGSFVNAGTVEIGASSTLSATADYTQLAGQTTLSTGTLDPASVADFQGGTLRGTGTVGSDLAVSGTVRIGDSVGDNIAVSGTYQQGQLANLQVRVGAICSAAPPGGPQRGCVPPLTVTSGINLSGALSVELINGYVPSAGETIPIVSYASRTGHFDSFATSTLCTATGAFRLDYNANDATITINTPLNCGEDGDIDGNGTCGPEDIAPFVTLLLQDGGAEPFIYEDCWNLTGDCTVDGADLQGFVNCLTAP